MNIKKLSLGVFMLLSATQMQAQDVNAAASGDEVPVAVYVAVACAAVVIFVLSYMAYALYIVMLDMKNTGAIKDLPAIFKLTDAVPIEKEHEIDMNHDYDGIRELDNKLPPSWVAMFYVTVIWAVIYMWYYHSYNDGNVQDNEYRAELVESEQLAKLVASKINENNVTLLTDKAKIENGKTTFNANCAACHGKLGEGGVGPNLTDDYWLHGGDVKDVFKSIKYGIPAKGMIPWEATISPSQIQEVSSYIKTLRGTNPPNQKAAQGDLFVQK